MGFVSRHGFSHAAKRLKQEGFSLCAGRAIRAVTQG